MTVEENLKTKALKVLVLKVAAHLQWNLSALEKKYVIHFHARITSFILLYNIYYSIHCLVFFVIYARVLISVLLHLL